jgi:hypothetical protein
MGVMDKPDVENIPSDLDRFLGNFFNRRGWRSEIKYDPVEDRLYLDVRLESPKLSADDRFFSLIEYYARAQDSVLRRSSGLPLQCRVYGADGSDLSGTLHKRGSSYLDDNARGTGMRRRLLWLSFRRRLFGRVLPGALLWALTFILVVDVLGVPFSVAVVVSIGALAVQALVLWSATGRRR